MFWTSQGRAIWDPAHLTPVADRQTDRQQMCCSSSSACPCLPVGCGGAATQPHSCDCPGQPEVQGGYPAHSYRVSDWAHQHAGGSALLPHLPEKLWCSLAKAIPPRSCAVPDQTFPWARDMLQCWHPASAGTCVALPALGMGIPVSVPEPLGVPFLQRRFWGKRFSLIHSISGTVKHPITILETALQKNSVGKAGKTGELGSAVCPCHRQVTIPACELVPWASG